MTRTLIALLLATAAVAQEEPDYKHPSDAGDRDTEPRVVFKHSIRQEVPTLLPCGKEFYFKAIGRVEKQSGVSVSEQFQAARQRAVDEIDEIMKRFRCPAECTPLAEYEIGYDYFDRGDFEVDELFAIVCPTERLPPDLPQPKTIRHQVSYRRTKKPWKDAVPDETVEHPVIEEKACPFVEKFEIRLDVAVPSCAAITDFKPYVDSATRDAESLRRRVSCETPCTKQKIDPVYTAWRCVANPSDHVSVTMQFDVSCK